MKSLLLGLFCIIFLASPAWGSTLQRESKDECCICHVLWFDSLAKGEKTLLERTDSPIVVAGSAGLVSSRGMCYSCHEGYVADSRNIIFRENKHQLVGKVPEDLKLPEIFRLTKNNEFYCGTCHGLHDVRAMGEVGETPFTRMDNDRSQMCIACHAEKIKLQKYAGHPVLKKIKDLSISSIRKKGPKFSPEGELICQSCHNSHGRRAMIAPVEDSAVCLICHENNSSLLGTEHDLRVTLPNETNIKKEPLSVSGPCGACHTPHSPVGPKLWARKFEPGSSPSQMCLSCHDKNSDDKIKDTGRYSHPVNVDQVLNLNQKISGVVAAGRLPLFPKIKGKQPTGTVECFSCHNPHQWDPNSPENRGGKDVDGDASNSFLRISNLGDSPLCLECHTDKKQLLSYDHNLKLTAVDEKNIQGLNVSASGPCGACHVPHNAEGPKLWARELSKDKELLPQYCLGCHNKNGSAKEKLTGENDHPVNVVSKGFNIAPPDRVTKVLPLFNKDGGTEIGEIIGCLTCHDPHIWTANNMSQLVGPVDTTDDVVKNREGDASSSFLRKSASPSPGLCITCHEETALLVGTDHDLFVTAPTAKNLADQTVKESGQCGVCHAAHNSPNKLKLFAREYGPVAENQHPMNALCTSCHSKDGSAKEKIPPVAIHPEGQLISNIMSFNNQGKGYLPIFDGNGKEVNVGDLSCSSCHSFYMWDHRSREKGPHKNIEGNASTSFLRISSDSTFCADCHGEEAIWRYTYFHSTQKREKPKTKQ